MVLFLHLLVGAAFASKVPYPALALVLAFLSHYFLDILPQTEYSITNIKKGKWKKTKPEFLKVALDIALGLLFIFIFSDNTFLIFAGAFLAIIPDGFSLLLAVFPKNKLLKKHGDLHFKINAIPEYKKIPLWVSLLIQAFVVLLAIFYLLQ
ncbi:MAG: hypothetical protein ABH805_02720 [Candidatus Nealsonbacteria bacterium]